MLIILTLLCYGCIGIPYPKQTIAIEAYDEFGTFIKPEDLKVLLFSEWLPSPFTTIFYQEPQVLNVSNVGLVEGIPKLDSREATKVKILVFTQNSYVVNISEILSFDSSKFSPFRLYKGYPNQSENFPFVVACLPRRDVTSERIYNIISDEWRTRVVQTGNGLFFPNSDCSLLKLGEFQDMIIKEGGKDLLEKLPWENLSESIILDGSLLTLLLSRFDQFYSYKGEATPSIKKNIIKFAINTLYNTKAD